MKVISAYKGTHSQILTLVEYTLHFKNTSVLFVEDKLHGKGVQDKPFFLIPNP